MSSSSTWRILSSRKTTFLQSSPSKIFSLPSLSLLLFLSFETLSLLVFSSLHFFPLKGKENQKKESFDLKRGTNRKGKCKYLLLSPLSLLLLTLPLPLTLSLTHSLSPSKKYFTLKSLFSLSLFFQLVSILKKTVFLNFFQWQKTQITLWLKCTTRRTI